MKEVLIIRREQFGYHTDIFKWCENLCNKYRVSVISFDYNKPKISIKGVKVHYVPIVGPRVVRGFLFLITCFWYVLLSRGVVVVSYFPGCHVIKKMFPLKKMILDVRTMDVSEDPSVRLKANKKIVDTAGRYDFCTPISQGVADQLSAEASKISILPLGADCVTMIPKSFESLNLLYVGTFFNRNLEKTLLGLSQAIGQLPSDLKIHYDIIGDGKNGEMQMLKSLTEELGLQNVVTFHGYIRHDLLASFFEKCNIGVSFVPQTPYYDHQPVTKTFEYVLSGLYAIGTSTYCNKEVINSDNGFLIQDTPESFSDALVWIATNRKSLDSDKIRNTLIDYKWENIVHKNLIPVIERCMV